MKTTGNNTQRFTGRVTDYVRYRTRYPREALTFVEEHCGLEPGWRVADVGAGTGMLAELFLEYGCAVDAVEPNAEMRSACEELVGRYPKLQVLDGTAEATGLEDGSVEMVSAGRAFHWFDPAAAGREFQRILRPGGWILLVASGRSREDSAQSKDYDRLLMEYGTDTAHVRDRYNRADNIAAFFAEGELHRVELKAEQRLTLEELIGVTRSYSCTPLAGAVGDTEMLGALTSFFDRWSVDGEVRMSTSCFVNVGRLSTQPAAR